MQFRRIFCLIDIEKRAAKHHVTIYGAAVYNCILLLKIFFKKFGN